MLIKEIYAEKDPRSSVASASSVFYLNDGTRMTRIERIYTVFKSSK
jgi:hypothetical protein